MLDTHSASHAERLPFRQYAEGPRGTGWSWPEFLEEEVELGEAEPRRSASWGSA